jgi:hypothetical protein
LDKKQTAKVNHILTSYFTPIKRKGTKCENTQFVPNCITSSDTESNVIATQNNAQRNIDLYRSPFIFKFVKCFRFRWAQNIGMLNEFEEQMDNFGWDPLKNYHS